MTCRGPQIWNELQTTTKMSASLYVFKESLRQQLLLKYVHSEIPEDFKNLQIPFLYELHMPLNLYCCPPCDIVYMNSANVTMLLGPLE